MSWDPDVMIPRGKALSTRGCVGTSTYYKTVQATRAYPYPYLSERLDLTSGPLTQTGKAARSWLVSTVGW